MSGTVLQLVAMRALLTPVQASSDSNRIMLARPGSPEFMLNLSFFNRTQALM